MNALNHSLRILLFACNRFASATVFDARRRTMPTSLNFSLSRELWLALGIFIGCGTIVAAESDDCPKLVSI
jgi:hypothetical protein